VDDDATVSLNPPRLINTPTARAWSSVRSSVLHPFRSRARWCWCPPKALFEVTVNPSCARLPSVGAGGYEAWLLARSGEVDRPWSHLPKPVSKWLMGQCLSDSWGTCQGVWWRLQYDRTWDRPCGL